MRTRLGRTLAVLGIAALLGAVAAVGAARMNTTATDTAIADHPATDADVSATERLRRLAGTITAAPRDSAEGTYSFHHLRRWILTTTGRPVPPGVRPDTPAVMAVDIRRWQAADGSGRSVQVDVGPDYTLAGAEPYHPSTDREFADGTPSSRDYPPGSRRSPLTGPPATDPAALARQLAMVDPIPDGPQATLRAVDELYTSFYVHLPVRRAVLRILADIGGLALRDAVADRLGRTGIAVSVTDDGTQYTLILDATTGQLLASEQRSLGAHDYLHVPAGLVTYYTLIVDQSRRPELS